VTRQLKRQRCVSCSPENQAMIREAASNAGKTISGYLLDLALDDDPEIHDLVLSPDEQREIIDHVRVLAEVCRVLQGSLPDHEGLNLFGVEALMRRTS